MRIYSMTATFGKLDHETLELKPGMNIFHAPNEWGKSTWCAFMVAMFYGLETRAKSTKTSLADKERYVPWSGKPMAGSMDLRWNGKDITIQRTTKGRVPLGEFRAFETATGIPVPELTAANCGQTLLGVERSVFQRSGFIRLSDLPVTHDEALRRRLNALVTTGDESSAGDRLAQGLKEAKNQIRYNRTGMLPRLEEESIGLEGKLLEWKDLQQRKKALDSRVEILTQGLEKLQNHRVALEYAAAEEDARRVAQARQIRDEAERILGELDLRCAELPPREQLTWGLEKILELEQAGEALELEFVRWTGEIELPEPPAFVRDEGPEAVRDQAVADAKAYAALRKKKPWLMLLGLLMAVAGGLYWQMMAGMIAAVVGAVLTVIGLAFAMKAGRQRRALESVYGSEDPQSWVAKAEAYKTAREAAEEKRRLQQIRRQELEQRREDLQEKIRQMTQGRGLSACREDWTQALARRDALAEARRDWQKAEDQLNTVKAMARTAEAPAFPDELTLSMADTRQRIGDAREELNRLKNKRSEYTGRMEALGDAQALEERLAAIQTRRKQLETAYGALTLAQEALVQAKQELQRRFAPRISKRARELMARMTDGRYDRLQLSEDFSLLAATDREDTLHEAIWRSEGTLDQLYLALRLAVAEALAPRTPLILDDALVRFDDDRLKAALEILEEASQDRQVILFSCQSREERLME